MTDAPPLNQTTKPNLEMTGEEQVELWVNGNFRCPNENGECCPDFSCCTGRPVEVVERKAFAAGDEKLRSQMLMGFLGHAMSGRDEKIHIVDPDRHTDTEEH